MGGVRRVGGGLRCLGRFLLERRKDSDGVGHGSSGNENDSEDASEHFDDSGIERSFGEFRTRKLE